MFRIGKEDSVPGETFAPKKQQTKLLLKAPGKLHELMMPEKGAFGSQSYSNMIGQRIEQRRAQIQQEEESRLQTLRYKDEDNFNSEILKSRFAAEVPTSSKKAADPAMRPAKSEAMMKPVAKYMLEDNPILGGKPKFNIVRPRDKKLRLPTKLDPLALNIFESAG